MCVSKRGLWQEWSSPAFPKYIDLHRLDAELVVQAHLDESDSSDSDSDWLPEDSDSYTEKRSMHPWYVEMLNTMSFLFAFSYLSNISGFLFPVVQRRHQPQK